jgi:hypothetical protein
MSSRVPSRLITLTAMAVGALHLTAFAAPQEPPAGEDAFAPFDLATTGDLAVVEADATGGDPAAQYAMALVTLHGLRGRPVDLAASGTWNSAARRSGPQVMARSTRIVPGGDGQPAQMRTVDRPVSEAVRAWQFAYGSCVAEVLQTRPNPEACGTTPETRERRKAAWRAATARD